MQHSAYSEIFIDVDNAKGGLYFNDFGLCMEPANGATHHRSLI